jgi:hypothetical protein
MHAADEVQGQQGDELKPTPSRSEYSQECLQEEEQGIAKVA